MWDNQVKGELEVTLMKELQKHSWQLRKKG
jgi:hypothetical protein